MREGNTGTCGDEGHCEGTKGFVLFTEERKRVKNEEGMRKGETVTEGQEHDDRRNGGGSEWSCEDEEERECSRRIWMGEGHDCRNKSGGERIKQEKGKVKQDKPGYESNGHARIDKH